MRQIETERLILRPIAPSDAGLALKIASDPGTTRYLYYWGRATPEAEADRFLRYAVSVWQESPQRAWEYCAVRRDTGEAIGNCSVEWVAEGTAELGWILLPAHRKQGFATEMGRSLLRCAFLTLRADCALAHCDQRNLPSRRVMERLGMTLQRIAPGARPAKAAGEAPGDECTYALSRADWASGR